MKKRMRTKKRSPWPTLLTRAESWVIKLSNIIAAHNPKLGTWSSCLLFFLDFFEFTVCLERFCFVFLLLFLNFLVMMRFYHLNPLNTVGFKFNSNLIHISTRNCENVASTTNGWIWYYVGQGLSKLEKWKLIINIIDIIFTVENWKWENDLLSIHVWPLFHTWTVLNWTGCFEASSIQTDVSATTLNQLWTIDLNHLTINRQDEFWNLKSKNSCYTVLYRIKLYFCPHPTY